MSNIEGNEGNEMRTKRDGEGGDNDSDAAARLVELSDDGVVDDAPMVESTQSESVSTVTFSSGKECAAPEEF